MQYVNVFENGIGYLGECLSKYLGSCAYLLLFIFAAVYILIKGDEEEREIFIPGIVMMIITVYNPLFPVLIDKFFDISGEYYRFFWIAPVVVLVPFVVSKLISGCNNIREGFVVGVFVIVAMFMAGNFVYEEGIPFAENMYKVPDELIEVSQLIHSDSTEEYPKAFLEYDYNMEMRQFDPKMLLTIDREEYIYAVNYSYSDEMIYDDNVPSSRLLAILVRNQDVDMEAFIDGLELTKTEYVVVRKGHPRCDYLEKAGLNLIGTTDSQCIYKYNLSEPAGYALIDYTDVEHKFSFRRIK